MQPLARHSNDLRLVRLAGLCVLGLIVLTTACRRSAPPQKGDATWDAAARLRRLKAPAGFEVEIAAGPPLVKFPMMACLDDQGRLYVAESAGVNRLAHELLEDPPHQILMLSDDDGDGVFDRRTVFAEGLVYPNGAAWLDGALYVCSPPYLWRLEDTDDDGVADVREKVLGRFNFTGRADSLHGPVVGPDGRLYFCGGQHGWTLGDPRVNPPIDSNVPGVFAVWPDGSSPEAYASGGVANPVEVAFTPAGDVLGSVAVYDEIDGRHDAYLHWIHGGVYNLQGDRIDQVRSTGRPLPALVRMGQTAPAGNAVYRGDHFGREYQGDVFLCQFNLHEVVRLDLSRRGATFQASSEVFLASDDSGVHFTDVLEDADGSLLVVDTGGWFLLGCAASEVSRPEVQGAIYRIRKTNGSAPDDPRGNRLAWNDLDEVELVELLGDDRLAVRDRAVSALAQRVADGGDLSPLAAALQSENAARRLSAVWALCRIGDPPALEAIRFALDDSDDDVRQAAALAVGVRRDALAVPQLRRRLSDPAPRVARVAAEALGRIGDAAAIDAIGESLASATDEFLRHALTLALIQIGDGESTAALLASPSPRVRLGALLALDQMDADASPADRLTAEMVVPLLDADDVPLQDAALRIIGRRAGWGDQAADVVDRWLAEPAPSTARLEMLSGALAALSGEARFQEMVARRLAGDDAPPDTRAMLWRVMARSDLAPPPASWRDTIDATLALRSGDELALAIAAAGALGWGEFDARLARLARDVGLPASLRLASYEAVRGEGFSLVDDDIAFLTDRLADPSAPLDRIAAADAIGRATFSDLQLRVIAELLVEATPLEAPRLLRAYEQSTDLEVGIALTAALERSAAASTLPVGQLQRLLESYPEEVRAAAAPVIERARFDPILATSRIEVLIADLARSRGDIHQGREVFFGGRGACSTCHRVGEQGGAIGPNLTRIGAIRDRRGLVESVLLPSATLARGYEPVTVRTADGGAYSGVIAERTSEAFTLRTADRGPIRLAHADVEEVSPSTVSVMPQGLEKVLSSTELRDLIEFLQSLQ